MIDHVGFPVADYARSKAFYAKALAPLGYELVMEVQQDETDSPAAGFGANGKPDFWIGGEGGLNRMMHVAITAKDRAAVDPFVRSDPYHVNNVWEHVQIHGYSKKRGTPIVSRRGA